MECLVVHFGGTEFVKTARLRTVCATSCHLSRISYELFTKCVTPNVTHVHLTISSWQVVSDTLEINFSTFQNFSHDMARTTSPDPHRHASLRTLSRVIPSVARQIACHGWNPLSCQCEACLSNDSEVVSARKKALEMKSAWKYNCLQYKEAMHRFTGMNSVVPSCKYMFACTISLSLKCGQHLNGLKFLFKSTATQSRSDVQLLKHSSTSVTLK